MLKYALRVHQQAEESLRLAGFFRATDVLVPVPGSTPYTHGGTWAAALLADALVHEGVGAVAWRGLHRICAVPKSATAAPGARPTVARHYESFAMQRLSITPPGAVLIDDVVTKGRTLLAAAAPSDATVTALEDLELLVLEIESVRALIEQSPYLSQKIGGVMEARRKALQMKQVPKA